jgi:hypothetical protein
MTGLPQVVALEDALGVTAGHDTTRRARSSSDSSEH